MLLIGKYKTNISLVYEFITLDQKRRVAEKKLLLRIRRSHLIKRTEMAIFKCQQLIFIMQESVIIQLPRRTKNRHV